MGQVGGIRIKRLAVALVAPMAVVVVGCDGKEEPTSIGSTRAALTDSQFEIDGNLDLDPTVPGNLDWINVPNRNTPGPLPGQNGLDLPSGSATDDSYAGGMKNDTIAPKVGFGSIPDSKDNLTRFYVANEHVACVQQTPPSAGCPCQSQPNGCEMLYIAWERGDTNGTANIDIEFNQNPPPPAPSPFPTRLPNDFIVSFDFTGGARPQIRLSHWLVDDGPGGLTDANCEANNGHLDPGCWEKLTTLFPSPSPNPTLNRADAMVNTSLVPDPIAGINVPTFAFGEAAINLTTSNVFQSGICQHFGAAFAKSRSSDSFTSALKDYIRPIGISINNCREIQLLKVDNATPSPSPLPGASLELWKENSKQAGLQRTGDNQDTLVGSCVSTAVNACTGSDPCNFDEQGFGTYYGYEVAAPPGYNGGGMVTQPIDINSPSCVTLTLTNSVVLGTINIQKLDDLDGFVDGIVFTLKQNGSLVTSCTTGQTGPGTCSMTGLALGTYELDEVDPQAKGYLKDPSFPKTVEIVAGSTPGQGDTHTFTAINPILFKVVCYVCDKRDNTLHASNVTVDGTMLTSFSAAPPSLLESALCGVTTGATFDNLKKGPHTGNINIPSPSPSPTP